MRRRPPTLPGWWPTAGGSSAGLRARYYYDVTGKQAALAAAEAFCYGANAMIRTDAAGLKPLAEMLEFLRTIPGEPLPPVADIGYIDDGSAASGEVMNLMVRSNLLFRLVAAPDKRLKLNVKLGDQRVSAGGRQEPRHGGPFRALQPDR